MTTPVGVVRLRSANARDGSTLVFSVPASIGKILVEKGYVGEGFSVEMNDDGILFRPIGKEEPIPAWLDGEA